MLTRQCQRAGEDSRSAQRALPQGWSPSDTRYETLGIRRVRKRERGTSGHFPVSAAAPCQVPTWPEKPLD
jgi:hypothetical protein